jgi:hypothetical protein
MTDRTDHNAAHVAIDAMAAPERSEADRPSWQRPRFTLIPLDCEISAYAPDGEDPLF